MWKTSKKKCFVKLGQNRLKVLGSKLKKANFENMFKTGVT